MKEVIDNGGVSVMAARGYNGTLANWSVNKPGSLERMSRVHNERGAARISRVFA